MVERDPGGQPMTEPLLALELDKAIREMVNAGHYIDICDSLDFDDVPAVAVRLAAIMSRDHATETTP